MIQKRKALQKPGQQAATEHAQNSAQNRKPNGQSVDEAAEILQDRRSSTDILLDIRHLTQVFPLTKKLAVRAVDDVSFQIRGGGDFWSGRRIRIRKVNGCAVCDEYLSSGRREDRVSWD